MPTAFAACFDIPVAELITEVGHDGSEILFPNDPEPYRRRGFHIQEFVNPCIKRGFAPVFIEAHPSVESLRGEIKEVMVARHPKTGMPDNVLRMSLYMIEYIGVVIGTKKNNHEHALAWNREHFYDNDGKSYEDYDIDIGMFIALLTTE